MKIPGLISLFFLLERGTLPSACAQRALASPNSKGGGDTVIVRGALGGDIFGFDIDPNNNTGLLCEAVGHADGTVSVAVETFDQTTGEILETVAFPKPRMMGAFGKRTALDLGVINGDRGGYGRQYSLHRHVVRFRCAVYDLNSSSGINVLLPAPTGPAGSLA